jgi:hypothetical protein
MKELLFVLMAIFIFGSCASDESEINLEKYTISDQGGVWMEIDKVNKEIIADRAKLVFERIQNDSIDNEIIETNPEAGEPEWIKHFFDEGGSYCIFSSTTSDTISSRNEYYFESDSLIMARLRTWVKDPENGYSRETIIYISNNEPLYAEEREVQLSGDEIPAKLLEEELVPSTRSKAELLEELNKYWPAITRLVFETK